MDQLPLQPILLFALYVLIARCSLIRGRTQWRSRAFALTNLVFVAALFYQVHAGAIRYAAYLGIVVISYVAMRLVAKAKGALPWVAFSVPILALVLIRYVPALWWPMDKLFVGTHGTTGAAYFIGISYMAFRLSYLVWEVGNDSVPMPTLSEYLGFAFFVPTMVVGPINRFKTHREFLYGVNREATPVRRSLLRILIGAVKFQFAATLCNQLAYQGLLLDLHRHSPVELGIAAVAYYLYLYLNFSGFCDIAIGAAGLIGVHVRENFDNPFAARNVKDFWNRWHITLSEYVRDVVFAPLSRTLIIKLGPQSANHAIACAIFVAFVLVGAWHGWGWHFVLFGVLHAFGVIVNHYYGTWLKKRLGTAGLKAYNANPYITAAATMTTFLFVTATFFVFANDTSDMKQIFHAII
ncbi:MAG TPA: MBOAT family O-acyltransferase [Planktothrix sp.]|jgi:D-alanyl-lipoteichoic acid acyltransferase DltB (MBOAT superfamily)